VTKNKKIKSSAPLFSEGNHLRSDAFFDSFFTESTCSVYGWGPIQIYPANTKILQQDTPSNAVYFLNQGLVKLTWIDQAGHEVIAGLRRQQWIIGAPSVLLDKPYSFSITTLIQCSLRCISANNFLHLLKINSEFSFHMLRMLSQEIFNHAKKLVILGCIPGIERLKNLLYQLITDMQLQTELHENIRIALPFKHKELAQIIAVTPEHLSRLLKKLEKQGIIKREKDSLILLDSVKLKQWTNIQG